MHHLAFAAFEAEVTAVIEAAGYCSPVLSIKKTPADGWGFECLALAPGRNVRSRLVKPEEAETADELLRLLGERISVSHLQSV